MTDTVRPRIDRYLSETGLAAQGAQFRTSSDTEVMVQAIARQGWSVLDRCEGMWAFALFDEAAGVLSLCRDRFGEKPLYWCESGGSVFFASEIKALLKVPGIRAEADLQAVRERLQHPGHRAVLGRVAR